MLIKRQFRLNYVVYLANSEPRASNDSSNDTEEGNNGSSIVLRLEFDSPITQLGDRVIEPSLSKLGAELWTSMSNRRVEMMRP